MAKNGLLIDYKYCTGCHSCEVACKNHLGLKTGKWGIRIENLVAVEKRRVKGAERDMLGFETLTLCPIDRRLVDVGGRVYFAKDSRVSARHVERMYPRLGEWREVCERVDPARRFQSDLSRRLCLRG